MFSLPAGTLISGLACSHKERASQVLITQLQLFFSESESILCNHNTILYFDNTAGFFSPPLPLSNRIWMTSVTLMMTRMQRDTMSYKRGTNMEEAETTPPEHTPQHHHHHHLRRRPQPPCPLNTNAQLLSSSQALQEPPQSSCSCHFDPPSTHIRAQRDCLCPPEGTQPAGAKGFPWNRLGVLSSCNCLSVWHNLIHIRGSPF